jgi:hypothetical protein
MILRMLRFLFLLPVLFAVSSAAQTASANAVPTEPAQILSTAMDRYQLLHEGIKPWHLRATAQLFDEKGNVTESGTIEHFYAGPKQQRMVYAFPSFQQTRVVNESGAFRENSHEELPYDLALALKQLFSPQPDASDFDGAKVELRKQKLGAVSLRCLMLNRPIKSRMPEVVPIGLFPTYCLDEADIHLRVAYFFGGNISVVYNGIGRFLESDVPTHLTIFLGTRKIVQLDVTELSTMPKVDTSLFATPSAAEKVPDVPESVAGGLAAGHILKKAPPVYPESAKRNHIAGSVVLRAFIGRDGRIRDLRIVSTPDVDLAISAVLAVRHLHTLSFERLTC